MSLQVALKDAREAMSKAVVAMRTYGLEITKAVESGDEAKAKETQERFDKAHGDFETHRKNSDRIEKAIAAEKEMAVVVNPVQTHAADPPPARETTAADVAKGIRETFMTYLRYGDKSVEFASALREKLSGLGPQEKHALLGTQGNLGGFLVPEDFRADVVKNLAGYAVFRRLGARVVQTTSSTLTFPSIAGGTDPYSTGVSGAWRAEGSQGTDGTAPSRQDQPTFGQESVQVHVWQPDAIVVTRELLLDSAINLDSLIAQLIAETKAMDEDAAFIKGTGIGQPRGVMNYVGALAGPAISSVNTGSTSAVQYNELVDMIFTLPAQYRANAKFLMSSATFAACLKLKDSANQPLLYGPNLPDRLFGKQVEISEFMPAIGSGNYPILYGDFGFYCIAERTDLRMQRLEERFAPNVAFLPTARLGGGVLRTVAFIAAKCAV